jgi:hypothetical protein
MGKPFDIVDTAVAGYGKVWAERHFIGRMAFIPFIIKALLLTLIIIFGLEAEFLRQALIMLPAYFAEGWLMAVIARLVFYDEKAMGRDAGKPYFMAGTLMYVLIKFLQNGAMAIAHSTESFSRDSETSPGTFLLALALFSFSIWAFRFLWVYIPLSLDLSIETILRLFRGAWLSLYIIGTWLLCFVPFMLLLILFTGIVVEPYESVEEIPVPMQAVLVGIQAAVDMVVALVSTAAITCAFRAMISNKSVNT